MLFQFDNLQMYQIKDMAMKQSTHDGNKYILEQTLAPFWVNVKGTEKATAPIKLN